MNQLFCSNLNVILMQKTCGQRSNMASGRKRRALALLSIYRLRRCHQLICVLILKAIFVFTLPCSSSCTIWYMLLKSKCRRESDLGLCMTQLTSKIMNSKENAAAQCIAVRCSALQCVAVHCSALQCIAVRCSALQCIVHDLETFKENAAAQWRLPILKRVWTQNSSDTTHPTCLAAQFAG